MPEARQSPGTEPPHLDRTEARLASDRAPEDAMQLSEPDGFLTGIAIGPQTILPNEWLSFVWGSEEPVSAYAAEAKAVLGAIMARYNAIVDGCRTRRVSLSRCS